MNISQIYEKGAAQQLWNAWNQKQRVHFLIDHADMFMEVMKKDFNTSSEEFAKLDFMKLPNAIRKEVIIHHAMGIYKEGGAIKESSGEGKYMVKYVGKRWFVIYKFSDGEEMIMSDPLKTEKGAEAKKGSIMDMAGVSDKMVEGGNVWTSEQKKAVAALDAEFETAVLQADIKRNSKEASDFWREAGYKMKMQKIFQKMKEGGKLTPAKQKLVAKIDKIKKAMADIKSDNIRKAMQKKIDKLQAAVDYNPSIKQKVAQGTGRFFIDIPTENKKKLYKALWIAGIKPKMHTLNGSTKVIFTNAGLMQKGYGIYAALLSNMGKQAPELSAIKGKL